MNLFIKPAISIQLGNKNSDYKKDFSNNFYPPRDTRIIEKL